jgi:hypothetical protein
MRSVGRADLTICAHLCPIDRPETPPLQARGLMTRRSRVRIPPEIRDRDRHALWGAQRRDVETHSSHGAVLLARMKGRPLPWERDRSDERD